MKKVIVTITEKLEYNREIIVGVPDDMTEEQFGKLLDQVQHGLDHAEDVACGLNRLNKDIKIIEQVDNDLSSPDDVEVEIFDYDFE